MDKFVERNLIDFKSKILKINNCSNEKSIKQLTKVIEEIVEYVSVNLPSWGVDKCFSDLEIIKNYLVEVKCDNDNNTQMIVIKKSVIDVLDSLIHSNEISKKDDMYDVFLSHANADKKAYINDLYKEISKLGLNVFYDSKEIEWGDKWKERILDATARSHFAIIVISKNFFGRTWTQKELTEFLHRQNETNQKIVLPLLYEVTSEEMKTQYPYLEDIQYIEARNYSKKDIALLFANQYIKHLKK